MESASEHMAVPLDSVLRIERIPRAQMERLNGMSVLRFDGALLPVQDKMSVDGASPESEMTVVVCHDGGRHVGVAVAQVLDVAPGESLTEAGTNAATQNVILLKDRVTSIVDLEQIPALPGTRPPQTEVIEAWETVGRIEVSA
jgi:two-component system chemotaxis sensor kinase CheA